MEQKLTVFMPPTVHVPHPHKENEHYSAKPSALDALCGKINAFHATYYTLRSNYTLR